MRKEIDALKSDQKVEDFRNKYPAMNKGDISEYMSGVVQIECDNSKGSGSLWKLSDGSYAVLTNYHVIEHPLRSENGSFCQVWVKDDEEKTDYVFRVYPAEDYYKDVDQDIALMPLRNFNIPEGGMGIDKKNPKELNYSISELSNCPARAPISYPVYIIGYPASGSLMIDYGAGIANQSFRLLTEGIISGHDTSISNSSGDPEIPDFFVTAKIDAGNSGGIAISKQGGELCVLGIPTWVNVGEYDTQGLIQNINAIEI